MKNENHIRISKHNKSGRYTISGNNLFFRNTFRYKVSHEKILFLIYTIDYRGKTITPIKHRTSENFHFSITTDYLIKTGDYLIDTDESDEDVKTIYYK